MERFRKALAALAGVTLIVAVLALPWILNSVARDIMQNRTGYSERTLPYLPMFSAAGIEHASTFVIVMELLVGGIVALILGVGLVCSALDKPAHR